MRFSLVIGSLLLLMHPLCFGQKANQEIRKRSKKKKATSVPRYPLEIGFHIGTTMFLGDLGGTTGIGKGFILDTNTEGIRPSAGFFGRYSMGGHVSFRLEMAYLNLSGDDRRIGRNNFKGSQFTDQDGWFRFYRNMHFQSHVFELTNSIEIIPYSFESFSRKKSFGAKKHIVSPYGILGLGFMVFNPQAEYDGQWVDLQPLSTEGQGIIDGTFRYQLVQLIIPMGLGIRWEYNYRWILSLEINHRLTFTDYLDDVSKDYVDPAIYTDAFDINRATLATVLSRRSQEIDPNNNYGYLTEPGRQRGNPNNNDSYYTITMRLAFFLRRSRPLALIKDY